MKRPTTRLAPLLLVAGALSCRSQAPNSAPARAAAPPDAPEPRAIQGPEEGDVVELPEVGGLHHRYERRAA